MTSTTIHPTVRCNLEQTPEDVRYSCNGGLDNHDNHQNNARHEEKYHLLDNESCFLYSCETTLHKSCQHWAAFDKEESRSKGKKNQYFLNSGFTGLIFITTIIIVIVSSPPSSSSSSKLNRFIFITKNESTYQVLVSVPPYYHTQYGSKNQLQVKISEVK